MKRSGRSRTARSGPGSSRQGPWRRTQRSGRLALYRRGHIFGALPGRLDQGMHFGLGQRTVLAARQIAQLERSQPDPGQIDHRMLYRLGHQTNLAFFALFKYKSNQAVRPIVPDQIHFGRAGLLHRVFTGFGILDPDRHPFLQILDILHGDDAVQ